MATYVRTQTIDHPVGEAGRVSLNVTEGDIRARGIPGGDAHVRATFEIRATSEAEANRIFGEIQLRVTRGDGELSIGDEGTNASLGSIVSRLFRSNGHAELSVEADVPAAARLRLTSVSADTEVSGMRGDQRYRTVSGDLRLTELGGSVNVDTVSGDVSLRGNAPVAIQAQSVSGDLSITAPILRALRATTVSGDVEVEGELDGRGEYRIETVSGDLVVGLVGSAMFEVHGISTDVHSELDHRLEGQIDRRRLIIGTGGPRVAFNSMSGDISVRRARQLAPVEHGPAPERATELEILRALERGEISVDEATRRLAGDA